MDANKIDNAIEKKIVLIVTTLGAFLQPFGVSSVNVALPTIGKEFGMNATPEIFSHITIVTFGDYNKIELAPELYIFLGSETVEYENAANSGNPPQESATTTEDAYGLLNTCFYLPVCVFLGDFDLEMGYSVNIPTTKNDAYTYPVSSYFSFSIGYMLPLN